MHLIELALSIAIEAYTGKIDKGGQPYILHPLRLMARMSNDDARVVAILHDVIEDSTITADDLLQRGIPEHLVITIQCLSRKIGESYEAFIERIALNPLARLVKMADIEDNLDVLRLVKLSPSDLERVKKYHAAWYYLREGRNE